MSRLPPVQTYITATDPSTGVSSLDPSSGPVELKPYIEGSQVYCATLWNTNESPVDLNGPVDSQKPGPPSVPPKIVNPNGSTVSVYDHPPNSHSAPMHFTKSIDYGIVLSGTITLVLTDGSCTDVKAGGIIVQRGTIHGWHNRTDQWTRVVYVILAAKEILVEGQPLKGPFTE